MGAVGLYEDDPSVDVASSQAKPVDCVEGRKKSLLVATEEKESHDDFVVKDGVRGVSQSDEMDRCWYV